MSFDPLSAALNIGNSLIERIWPDPEMQSKEKLKLAELAQNGDLAGLNAKVQLLTGQIEVNKIEASSNNWFVAGWRPWLGWVGGFAMAYQFIVYPLLVWIWALLQAKEVIPVTLNPPPVLETGALFSMVTAMLGIGAMRSHDKSKGVNTRKVG